MNFADFFKITLYVSIALMIATGLLNLLTISITNFVYAAFSLFLINRLAGVLLLLTQCGFTWHQANFGFLKHNFGKGVFILLYC